MPEERSTPPAEVKRNKILQFISEHPIVGLIGLLGSIASLVGLPYAIWPPPSNNQLAYCVSNERAPIVQTTVKTDISVTYKGKRIDGDLTGALIAVWNSGSKPITTNDILTPLVLCVSNKIPIMEVSVLKQTRDLIQCTLDKGSMTNGEVGIKWNILEKNDGALIWLVYAGKPDASITLNGVLIGQPIVKENKAYKKERLSITTWAAGISGCGMGIGMIIWTLRNPFLGRRGQFDRIDYAFCLFLGSGVLIMAGMMSYTIMQNRLASTPFGF